MSEAVVRAEKLTKIYRLYSRPHYRFLDMFGALRNKAGAYTEHAALRDIDLEIRRGEKVAIIGRNGAGKSTLLKLITNVIEPTSGILEVPQGVHALLQLGTGFHPDFTGRENINSYLAHLGVSPSEAHQRIPEVIEFSELEEYIDQPIKTYSTGMVARLMFSVSTAMAPDILVLDEILGVGDAYFAQKSYDRMKELCSGSGTTLLLVSHDIYGASRLCERMIWIDRGRIMIDGLSPVVMKAYEDSIREQEEKRLRQKKQNRLAAAQSAMYEPQNRYLLLEMRSRHNLPLPCPVYFSDVRLSAPHSWCEILPLGDGSPGRESGTHLAFDAGCWGESAVWRGRTARPMQDHGSPFHKVTGVFLLPDAVTIDSLTNCMLTIDYCSEQACDLTLSAFLGDQEIPLGDLPPSNGQWMRHQVECKGIPSVGEVSGPAATINLNGVHGSYAIQITDVRAYNHLGQESAFVSHGEPISIEIDYQIRRQDLCEKPQLLVAFHRDGVTDVLRIITKELLFDYKKNSVGSVRMRVPKLGLANGTYTVTVMLATEGYYDRDQTVFYSINPEVHMCLSRVLEISVTGGGIVGTGTGVVGEADWSFIQSADDQAQSAG